MPFYTVKRGRPRLGRKGATIAQFGGSFPGQIDREAVTKMSGRHWRNLYN